MVHQIRKTETNRTPTDARDEVRKSRPSSSAELNKQEENAKNRIRMAKILIMETTKKAVNPMAGRRAKAARKRRLRRRKELVEGIPTTTKTRRSSLDPKMDIIQRVTKRPSRGIMMKRMIVDERRKPG